MAKACIFHSTAPDEANDTNTFFAHCRLEHGDDFVASFSRKEPAREFLAMDQRNAFGIWQPKGTRAAELGHYRGFAIRYVEHNDIWKGATMLNDSPFHLTGANPAALCLAIDEFLDDTFDGEEE